jgi:phage gpG-like protein
MSGNEQELVRLEGWIGGLQTGLSPAAISRSAREIASLLRARQAQRIAAQRNPDGSAFAARKPIVAPEPRNSTLKFLYPAGGAGQPRAVLLKRWSKQGPLCTGYDVEAGGLRSFEKSKITKWLRATPEEQNKRAGSAPKRPTIKSRIMFRKMRRYALLKAGSTKDQAWAGYDGVAAQIGRVHQEGGFDRAAPKAPLVRYEKRQLLGLTSEDENDILDLLIAMVSAP